MMPEETCDKCGGIVVVGAWPFCNPGGGPHATSGITYYADKFEPFVSKHLDQRPIPVTSRRHHEALMRERGFAPLADFPVSESERQHVERAREERGRKSA